MERTTFEIINNIMIIHINGDLDHHSAKDIKKVSDEKIYGNMVKNIIFDFENTDFMDSSGIGVIMGRYKMIRSVGGKVIVINVKNSINKILTFSGMDKIVFRAEKLEDALEILEVI